MNVLFLKISHCFRFVEKEVEWQLRFDYGLREIGSFSAHRAPYSKKC